MLICSLFDFSTRKHSHFTVFVKVRSLLCGTFSIQCSRFSVIEVTFLHRGSGLRLYQGSKIIDILEAIFYNFQVFASTELPGPLFVGISVEMNSQTFTATQKTQFSICLIVLSVILRSLHPPGRAFKVEARTGISS